MTNQNDKYKDALFKIVFGENRENALSLYNAINNTSYTNIDDLKITTLRDTVYIGIKNDVSFLFNHDMNLYEHQSTFCPNMPLRGLGYFADLYKLHLGGEETSRERMYGRKLLRIPAPKYYVFYNGTEKADETEELHLSSAYDGEGDIEVTAHMINVNKGHNKDLMSQCKPMADYSEFIYRVREFLKQGLSKEEAIGQAIDDCIRDDVMADLLRREKDRVENMMIIGLTEEQKEHLHKMELEQEREEAKYEDVDRIVAEGFCDAARACEILEVDLKAYNEYKGLNAARAE